MGQGSASLDTGEAINLVRGNLLAYIGPEIADNMLACIGSLDSVPPEGRCDVTRGRRDVGPRQASLMLAVAPPY